MCTPTTKTVHDIIIDACEKRVQVSERFHDESKPYFVLTTAKDNLEAAYIVAQELAELAEFSSYRQCIVVDTVFAHYKADLSFRPGMSLKAFLDTMTI